MDEYPDIYMTPEYAKLFEVPDRGTSCSFRHDSRAGAVMYSFLQRPIVIDGEVTDYRDIISPYGYGGPVIQSGSPEAYGRLLEEFRGAFAEHCRERKIVSEFVRFHPLLNNVVYGKAMYDVALNRQTVAIDLTCGDLEANSFSTNCKNKIRKAIKAGVTIRMDAGGEFVEDFHRLYTLTMHKNDATDYYFFTKEYFAETMRSLRGHIFMLHASYGGEIVSSAMFMHHGPFVHYHFSATHPEFYRLACNNLLLAEAARWGQDHGKKWLHLGGGYTTAADDPLLVFKKSFTKDGLCDFWVGRRVHNQAMYRELADAAVRANPALKDSSFFPLYRAR